MHSVRVAGFVFSWMLADFSTIRFFHKGYLRIHGKGCVREGRMEADRLVSFSQVSCDHGKQRQYTQRRFDVLNGFELVLTRCINCHKILALEAKKLGS